MSDKFKIINAPIFVTNIFCIIIFQAFPIFGLSQSYKSLVQKGNEFYENKSYAEAQTFFAEALKKKNNDRFLVLICFIKNVQNHCKKWETTEEATGRSLGRPLGSH